MTMMVQAAAAQEDPEGMVEEGGDTEAKVVVAIEEAGRLHYFSRTPTGENGMYTGVDETTCNLVFF